MDKASSNKILIVVIAVGSLCGCILLASSVLYLFNIPSQSNVQYFLTVNEVLTQESKWRERNTRISGVVLGDSIEYDESSLTLSFTIANVPAHYEPVERLGGLANVLKQAAGDPNNSRIRVIFVGSKPELLRHETQAIMTGRLGSDGIFYAEELLLRCPTRYEEAVPEQVN